MRRNWCPTIPTSIRPGAYADGYHLTQDLVDQSIRFIGDHTADRPDLPWLTWVALGACHAPHQAPADIIRGYDAVFAHGWDVEREQRMARQKAMGIVPPDTKMPARNDGVKAWDAHPPTRNASSRGCNRRLPACSIMPTGIWRG